jgi:hypothetical protein
MLKMKNTKTRSITVLLCSLALMLVMYNCKKKDEPLPDKPNPVIEKELDDINLTPVTLTPPAPVESTDASVELSEKAGEVNAALGDIASTGVIPASVSDAAAEVSAALPAADLAVLGGVTPAMMDAVKGGGEIPADVKAALDKAAANPAVQAYLPKFTLPTVGGVTINGRIAATNGVTGDEAVSIGAEGHIEAIQEASDVCIAAAEAIFQAKKTQLDAGKSAKDAEIATAYNAAIAPLASQQTECTSGLTATYAAYRAAVDVQVNQALADLDAAQAILGDLYPILRALTNIQALGAYSGLNTLQAAEIAACAAKTTAATTNAQAARDKDLAASQAAYDTALAAATTVKAKLVESCHNQGGGN